MTPSLPGPPDPSPALPQTPDGGRHRRRHRRRRRSSSASTPGPLRALDIATEALVCFLVVFTPWAFGTTQAWSIWTANAAAYVVGMLLVAKYVIRRSLDVPAAASWVEGASQDAARTGTLERPSRTPRLATPILAGITLFLLAYIAVSALNARADYDEGLREFRYFPNSIAWLPRSYDRGATWFVFWQYLGLACVFWAVRDWLLTPTAADQATPDSLPKWASADSQVIIPARLRRLLWLLCLNGAALALVSIIQRADGTNRLLWIVESRSNKPADSIFGPWSYRANAAQYFNLIWPVCIAFWLWAQERAGRLQLRRFGRFDGPQAVLLPCAMGMAACPMISASRGAAMVGAAMGLAMIVLILSVSRRELAASARWLTAAVLAGAGLLAIIGGWSTVRERLSQPDLKFATGINVGTNEFTLLFRLRVPERPDDRWHSIAAMAGNSRSSWQPYALHTHLSPKGELFTQILGNASTNRLWRNATNFLAPYGGKEVLIGVVRGNGLRVFADGVELGTIAGGTDHAPDWSSFVHSRYLFVADPAVAEVGLVQFSMTPEELAAASLHPLSQLGDDLLAASPFAESELPAEGAELSAGATAEVITRRVDPTNHWLLLRRSEIPGPLAYRHSLSGVDPRLRGPLRVTLRAWNPESEVLHLAAQLDGGAYDLAAIPPRQETVVSLPCRPPHGGVPRTLTLFLVDETGLPVAEVPPETELILRDLRLHASGSLFVQPLVRELRFFDLADRMSGRNEVYENARRMLQDFPVWGSGAGTFASLYQLYLKPGEDWAAYLHDDWAETRITLGTVGLGLVILGLLTLFLRSWLGAGLKTPRLVMLIWWLALGGCLAHARFDFPFQVYSVFFLFVILCAMLTVLTTARQRG